MAERIQVELVDDIDGSPAQQTVTFALDGVTYEIDLNERHAQRLRSVLARYVDRARAPERERPAPEPKRQERQEHQERATRQANKQLTEQIRGAAQRTKDRLNKQKDPGEGEDEPAESTSEAAVKPESARPGAASGSANSAPGKPGPGPESGTPAAAVLEQPAQSDQESGSQAVPAVSLPQFSSAVD